MRDSQWFRPVENGDTLGSISADVRNPYRNMQYPWFPTVTVLGVCPTDPLAAENLDQRETRGYDESAATLAISGSFQKMLGIVRGTGFEAVVLDDPHAGVPAEDRIVVVFRPNFLSLLIPVHGLG